MAGCSATTPRSPREVLLVAPSLSCGGAERVLVLLAQGLLAREHRVSAVTIFGEDHDFYRLPDRVRREALALGGDSSNLVQRIAGNSRRLRALRKVIRQWRPDVIVSFLCETNVLALLSTVGLKVPVVVTEHSDSRRRPPPGIWERLRRASYGRAARLVSVSPGVDAYFRWLPEGRRAVIPNPLCLAELRSPVGEAPWFGWQRTALGAGRLETEKGFDLLIRAFAGLAADFPEWGLMICGEGSQRSDLESLVTRLGLGGRVRLPGTRQHFFATLNKADLFVLPSRHEGFGNALVEAMGCGLPAIATDCWSEPPGIVRHGEDGLLVPPDDVDTLAAAMAELMADPEKRRRLGQRAKAAAERFDLDRVMVSWEELLDAVISRPIGSSAR